ncbi:hypothetical protein SRHO_G00240830 [Serrasalmus rhombeus]
MTTYGLKKYPDERESADCSCSPPQRRVFSNTSQICTGAGGKAKTKRSEKSAFKPVRETLTSEHLHLEHRQSHHECQLCIK